MSEGEDGNGRNGTNPAWPPPCDPEALEDPRVAAGVLKNVIGKQSDDERWIERVDSGVINLQKSVDALSARTDKWQREASDRLEQLHGSVVRLTNQVMLLPYIKIGSLVLIAVGIGAFVAQVCIYLIAHK